MPRAFVVPIILALNTLVYLYFQVGNEEFLFRHFLVSMDSLAEGRYYTLLTSEFSHASFLHFFLNMYVLFGFGPLVELTLGARRFLGFYLAAATLASLSHALLSAYLLGEPGLPALGASGAISGLLLLFALLFPRQRILLLGIIPMPAIFGAFLIVGIDLWGLYRQAHGGTLPIGHGAHLGGALAGLLYYFLRLRPMIRRGAR